jgi:hypothetical protein
MTETGAPAVGTLDTEVQLLSVAKALGPALQLQIAGRGSRERELAEQLPKHVERRSVMALLVGIHSDCDHRFLLIVWDGLGDVEAAGQSCVE